MDKERVIDMVYCFHHKGTFEGRYHIIKWKSADCLNLAVLCPSCYVELKRKDKLSQSIR